MPPSSTASEAEPLNPDTNDVDVLPKRAWLGVVVLVVLTVGSLGLAWWLPDMTLLHFLWVAQAVPVLYFVLAWWGTQSAPVDDDAL
jgi:hypothetical protein